MSSPRNERLDALEAEVKRLKEARVQSLKDALLDLTEEERLDIFGDYCKHCGRDDPGCRCWDDS